jgi:hypothetical protein
VPHFPDYLEPFNLATYAVVLGIILGGLWFVVGRAELTNAGRNKTRWTLAIVLLAWFSVAYGLAVRGVFQATPETLNPAIAIAIILPIVIALPLLIGSSAIAKVIDATPLSWLVGVQVYRVLGGIFLVLWSSRLLPGQFALPAGTGDVLTGLLAIPLARLVASRASNASGLAYAWNVFGILDLVVAVSMGFLTSPGQLQLLAHDQPNYLVTAYPLVLIPAFFVPLSIILHGLCLWKLRREAQSTFPYTEAAV